MEIKDRAEKHKAQSIHYWGNALHFIDAGDAEKASEFLWGSVTQALKAVAASNDIQLKSHNLLRSYAIALTKQLKDESIKDVFDLAQSLHSNFYETGLLMEDVAMAAEKVKVVVDKLLRLISEEDRVEK